MWKKKWRHSTGCSVKNYGGFFFNEGKQLWKCKQIFLHFWCSNPVIRDATLRGSESFNPEDLKCYQWSFINSTQTFSNALKCSVWELMEMLQRVPFLVLPQFSHGLWKLIALMMAVCSYSISNIWFIYGQGPLHSSTFPGHFKEKYDQKAAGRRHWPLNNLNSETRILPLLLHWWV